MPSLRGAVGRTRASPLRVDGHEGVAGGAAPGVRHRFPQVLCFSQGARGGTPAHAAAARRQAEGDRARAVRGLEPHGGTTRRGLHRRRLHGRLLRAGGAAYVVSYRLGDRQVERGWRAPRLRARHSWLKAAPILRSLRTCGSLGVGLHRLRAGQSQLGLFRAGGSRMPGSRCY